MTMSNESELIKKFEQFTLHEIAILHNSLGWAMQEMRSSDDDYKKMDKSILEVAIRRGIDPAELDFY